MARIDAQPDRLRKISDQKITSGGAHALDVLSMGLDPSILASAARKWISLEEFKVCRNVMPRKDQIANSGGGIQGLKCSQSCVFVKRFRPFFENMKK